MASHIDVFESWAGTTRQDADAFTALLASPTADASSRRIAAAARSCLVSRMDLIPDWNEGIGVMDDVIVIRVCAQLTQGHERGPLPTPVEICLDRMANEAEQIAACLGDALSDKMQAYCAKLVDQAVRGRTPVQLVDDAAARTAFYVEVEDEIKRTVPIVIEEPTDAELRLKAYLTHKLR